MRSATGAKPGVERGPRLRSERADEALLSLLPGGQRLMEEPAARLGERSSSLAPGRPREDPDTPAPDQWPDGTVEGGPVENEKLGESAERDRAAQVDCHQKRELGAGQIERREGGSVEARDRPGGAAEPSARALHLDASGQRGYQVGAS